ncbi:GntR family transcriptional regulator [Roseovarius sp. LXJ103]|uniref:GntR family transcriptional regulator n=1 Tax=Roseovarius carneus TaxID=2853164 RepID=UPI000D60EBE0|nr:GntR family transcriptional regulator [Roseovarius carneus]MBZ8117394.1 GntR family transcriptional regulator [Roseovarius carneus]PWE36790.1 GntR family transcriptional regulator [Pelagicola sp. LXJ1103]
MSVTYRDVKADILAKITQGELPPGSAMPNEVDLAVDYGCARATVNRAMRELADDGIIERRRKAGTRVRMAPVRQARFGIPLVRQEIETLGATYRYALVARAALAAPDWLRARLALEPKARALHLTCMHYADGMPYQHEDRWINLAVNPDAEYNDFAETGPNEWLVAAVPFSNAEISFQAVTADAALAEYLGCGTGEALFQVERMTWWEGRAVTFVRLTHRRGHRMTTQY